jgi:enamine deaminase RidA (YjgF/YER057c/UK114 family)
MIGSGCKGSVGERSSSFGQQTPACLDWVAIRGEDRNSRAVRAGNIIAVTGTAALSSEGKTIAKHDAGGQARRCLEIIQSAIEELGGKLSDVTRTRILLTRIEDWERVAAVHGEFFGGIRPANTIMQVVRFIDPDWLVEIEADAVVEG